MQIPDEIELLSLFECEPTLLDIPKHIPFYYNEATYKFDNKTEKFIVKLSPASHQIEITVYDLQSDVIITRLDLNNVEKIEILSDKKIQSTIIRLTLKWDHVLLIDFKPRFKLIMREQILR
jgi:hypothetical protein